MIKHPTLKSYRFKLCENLSFGRAILTHGGAGSNPDDADGPLSAAQAGMALMAEGQSALDAVVHAVSLLEDDPRFNAGTGSQRRADQQTIQMDASCMSSDGVSSEGRFGAVACVENVKNPIKIAKGVLLHSDHILIAGDGARLFAQAHNITTHALNETEGNNTVANNDQYSDLFDGTPSCDTVGAVAFDGIMFAAALSSGGLANAAIGRVGDVPLPGCGLYCGPLGTIACTGDGEFIALKMLAREIYGWLEQRINPQDAVKKALALFDDSVDIGLIVLTKNGFASRSRNGMAWSQLTSQISGGR
ncbi:MAG: beta-aspartyl-peptidase (threonine type) [Cellvibrionaceae bacterium]|jgi:beta-aspartyl-peptidase (threonine type)